jgi:hypothetical protein
MNVVVDVFVVKQVKKCSEFQDWKGNTDFHPQYISNLQIFGQDIAYVSVSLSPCLCPFMLTEFNLILPSFLFSVLIAMSPSFSESLHWMMKPKHQSYHFSFPVVCFAMKSS